MDARQPDLFGLSEQPAPSTKTASAGRLLFALVSLSRAFPYYAPELVACIDSIRCKRVLRAIERGAVSRWEIAELTKIPETTVHVYLQTLLNLGKIRRVEGNTPNRPTIGKGGTKPEYHYFPTNQN